MSPAISVIIPTLNEAHNVRSILEKTRAAGNCEIIVVDGGSTDETLANARFADLVLTAPRGRASQQNVGAQHASGEILIFLHADCELLPGFVDAVQVGLSDSRIVAGCFTQTITHPGKVYRAIELGNASRVHWLSWVYGDQGLFLRADTFREIGGFPLIPLMEDLYVSKRLKTLGKVAIIPHSLKVSPRRWEKRGVLRQTLSNWGFVLLSHLGVPHEWLSQWYGHVREVDLTSQSTPPEMPGIRLPEPVCPDSDTEL